MKLLVVFLSMCALAMGVALPRFDDKIIGGEETTIEDHPYQISLLYNDIPNCGGSIVNENTIVTAANCVHRFNYNNITIRVGSTDSTGGEEFKVERIFEHPYYMRDGKYSNDVAILKLARPLTFSDRVQPIELQAANTSVPEGTTALVTGWGTTIAGEPAYPTRLRVVDVDVISNARCESMYAGQAIISETMLCTLTIGHDSCQGDSGGPLVANGRLIGVVSWGRGCADPNYPSVYAKVSLLRDFIDQHL